MKFSIITLVPEIIEPFFNTGLMKKAEDNGIISHNTVNLREFGIGKHRNVDDYVYGGASGMILMAEPLANAVESIEKGTVILTAPSGRKLDQKLVEELTGHEHLIIVAGRYKGVDRRFTELFVDMEISAGDYVLQGGELPALIIADSVTRLLPGFMSDMNSAEEDSFTKGFLDCPRYTRPENFRGLGVPDILLSGNHQAVEDWELEQSIRETLKRRPDLIDDSHLTSEYKKIINKLMEEKDGKD